MKKVIVLGLILLLIFQTWGCYTEETITEDDLSSLRGENIIVVTKNGNEYDSKPNDWTVRNDTLFINTYDSKFVQTKHAIPFNSIESIQTSRLNEGNTILLATFSVLVVITIVIYLYLNSQPIFRGGSLFSIN